jgi:hypothetical protein
MRVESGASITRIARSNPSSMRSGVRPVMAITIEMVGFSVVNWASAQALVLSDGTVIDLPRTTSADRKRLTIAQRRVARKGSRNREKAKRRVARLQARYARRRRDARTR